MFEGARPSSTSPKKPPGDCVAHRQPGDLHALLGCRRVLWRDVTHQKVALATRPSVAMFLAWTA
jgi:hypothetical protein